MYRVMVQTEGKEYLLHEPRDNEGELQLIEPELTLEMGKNGSFEFRIAPGHPHKSRILPLKSEVSVYDDGALIFRGRPIGIEKDFWGVSTVSCEGDLAYLIDSIQRPYSITGSGAEFLQKALDVHNSQVGPEKQFKVGNVTVADTDPDVLRENDECENTLKALKAQLTERNGGYLRVRHAGDDRYLDYVSDYGGINGQVIRFGENMVDFTDLVKPTSIMTVLIPRGAEIETEDADAEGKQYVDITSVNGGKDYIFEEAAVHTYGWIWGAQTFDDAADPEVLLAKARAYLQESIALPETLELTAVDLGLIDTDVQKLKLGYWTQVESAPHGISKRFLLSKKQMHLDNPGKDEVVLGKVRKTFTASTNKDQAAISDRIDRIASSTSKEINRKIENATQLITGGKGGYVVLDVEDPDSGEKTHPWRILIMDTPDKDTATNVIQFNKNGIGFSRTGINGPYANAWTIDGNLVADFVTSGTMLADRIRGGTMEVGGTGLGRDGAIIVKDAAGNTIGSWDKTGLSILKGILQGVSAVFGGTDNQNGSIEVLDSGGRKIGRWDKDGLYIRRGDLTVGPFAATEDGVTLGDWEVSADGSNVFRSQDGSVVMRTRAGDGPTADHPLLTLTSANGTTETSSYHLKTQNLDAVRILISETTEWGADTDYKGNVGMILDYIWKDGKYGISYLGHNVRSLLSQVEDIWQRIEELENTIY